MFAPIRTTIARTGPVKLADRIDPTPKRELVTLLWIAIVICQLTNPPRTNTLPQTLQKQHPLPHKHLINLLTHMIAIDPDLLVIDPDHHPVGHRPLDPINMFPSPETIHDPDPIPNNEIARDHAHKTDPLTIITHLDPTLIIARMPPLLTGIKLFTSQSMAKVT